MANRVLASENVDYGYPRWYEVSQDRFVMGESWQEVANYLGLMLGRHVETRTLDQVFETDPTAVQIS